MCEGVSLARMGSVMALISKAVFEGQAPRAAVGDRLGLDRYVSANKGLEPLRGGGALFLVTVRPPERLWLCAILDDPGFETTMWRASPSAAPIVDITELLPSLRLANGKGIQAPAGKLGMSLQTPRLLAEGDAALLGAAAGAAPATKAAAAAPATKAAAAAPAVKTAAAARPAAPAPPPAKAVSQFAASPATAPRLGPASATDLISQIIADPDDLGARGVYADKLIEAGDPHGEYIQLACAADALPARDPRRADLERRAVELRRHHGLAFSRTLRAIPFFNHTPEGTWNAPYAFRRGFPEIVGGERQALDHVEAAAKVAPVRGLRLREVRAADVRRLAAMPALSRIRSLVIERGDRDGVATALVELFASPHLVRLEELSLTSPITLDVVRAIASAPSLAGLTALSLTNAFPETTVGAAGAEALARSPQLQRLEKLELMGLGIGPEGAEALAQLPALVELAIEGDVIGPRGARALAASAALAGLRRLTLNACDLGEKGAAAVVSSPSFSGLEELSLHGANALNGKKLAAIFAGWSLPALRSLSLDGAPLRAEGASALSAAAKKLAHVTALSVTGASLKDDGMAALARLRLPRLEKLDLGGNAIGPPGMASLAGGSLLDGVRELSLRRNKCGTEGGKNLGKSTHLAKLRSLALFYNWMGVHGIRAILAAAPELEELFAGENNYGDAPARFIAESSMKRVRVLHVTEVDEDAVESLAKSPAARTLAELSLSGGAVGEGGAQAIAALPELEQLALSFVDCEGPARAALRRRFGPNLAVWGSHEGWSALPGPD